MKDMRLTQPDWLAADWGTSRLRIWGMRANGDVIGRQFGDCRMSRLAKSAFEAEFIKLANPFLSNDTTLDVICCGMAGSRQGWAEASYVKVPCHPPGIAHAVQVETADPRINVFILPGIKKNAPSDVTVNSKFRGNRLHKLAMDKLGQLDVSSVLSLVDERGNIRILEVP